MIKLLFFAIDFTTVQVSALAAATLLSLPITHVLKKAAGVSGGLAFLVAGAVAAVLTVIAMFATGQAHSLADVLANTAGVFGVSQAIFKVIVYADRATKGGESGE